MIVDIHEVMSLPEFAGMDSSTIKQKLDGIENLIRAYTHNNFQNRNIRFLASSVGTVLNGVSPFLRVGDTVQVTQSRVNDGLYIITEIGEDSVCVDRPMFSVEKNLVTKVEYPIDLKVGLLNLLKWETSNRDKVGIKEETLSRHSVTYFDQDSSNQVMGYPVSLLGFLEPYKKARF